MKYESHILKMQEVSGFYEVFCKLIGEYHTNEEAYEAAERIFQTHFDKPRFKNYDSFRSSISQWHKKRVKGGSKQS